MKADFDKAATTAMETIIKYGVSTAPVMPLPIFKKAPGVLLMSFAEMSDLTDIDRSTLVPMFGESQDAATFHLDGKLKYIVVYNQRLPFYMLQRALARELGHIVLGHDGTRPEEVRTAEAYCFAHHLLCPRPLIRAIQDAGIRMTFEVLGSVTGCYERCLSAIRKEPAAHVPAEPNKAVREQFADYLDNLVAFQPYLSFDDTSALADFGHYMDFYTEGK